MPGVVCFQVKAERHLLAFVGRFSEPLNGGEAYVCVRGPFAGRRCYIVLLRGILRVHGVEVIQRQKKITAPPNPAGGYFLLENN